MVQPRSPLLVLVADSGGTRFPVPPQQRALQTVASFTSETAHRPLADLGADRPRASFRSLDSTSSGPVAMLTSRRRISPSPGTIVLAGGRMPTDGGYDQHRGGAASAFGESI